MELSFLLEPHLLFILSNIKKIEEEVEADDKQIEEIEPSDPVEIMRNLVDDAHHIAEDDDGHKNGAFPDYNFGSQRLNDRERPTAGETEEHKDFPNT